jgi:hypothetical protein
MAAGGAWHGPGGVHRCWLSPGLGLCNCFVPGPVTSHPCGWPPPASTPISSGMRLPGISLAAMSSLVTNSPHGRPYLLGCQRSCRGVPAGALDVPEVWLSSRGPCFWPVGCAVMPRNSARSLGWAGSAASLRGLAYLRVGTGWSGLGLASWSCGGSSAAAEVLPQAMVSSMMPTSSRLGWRARRSQRMPRTATMRAR